MNSIKKKNKLIYVLIITIIIAVALFYENNTNTIQSPTSYNTQQEYDGAFRFFENKNEALEALSNIETIDGDDGSEYSGDVRNNQYGNWVDIKGWSTRDEVLDTIDNNSTRTDTAFESGTWYIDYIGEELTFNTKKEISSNLQIDHIIPIGYVARHGGSSWDNDKSSEYYNDYGVDNDYTKGIDDSFDYPNAPGGVLIVSDSTSNISKSDKGPSEWMPSNKDYWIEYCERWVVIANTYDIKLDIADYNFIHEIFEGATDEN